MIQWSSLMPLKVWRGDWPHERARTRPRTPFFNVGSMAAASGSDEKCFFLLRPRCLFCSTLNWGARGAGRRVVARFGWPARLAGQADRLVSLGQLGQPGGYPRLFGLLNAEIH